MSAVMFEEEKKGLNKEQREAVETIQGPVMVVAGPGTGKTKILVLRIAEILTKTDTAPESILALTFTEAGASVMKQRLIALVGPAGRKVRIETFHKFAMSIERDYPDYFDGEDRRLIKDADKILGFDEAVRGLILKTNIIEPSNPQNMRSAILRTIDDLRRQGISAEDFNHVRTLFVKLSFEEKMRLHPLKSTPKKDQPKKMQDFEDKNEDFYHIYSAYESWINEHHYYDFSSVIIEVGKALKSHEDLKLTLQENFQYLLVDEYQDTNLEQHAIIMQLADVFDRTPNLFIVGDRKQAIYGFQGAMKEIFEEVYEEFPKIKIIKLKDNYRSTQNILDAAFSLSDYAKEALDAKGETSEGSISYVSYKEDHEMLFDIKEHIQKLSEAGTPFHDIAIISRNNRQLREIKEYLIQDFPVILYGNDQLFDAETVDLMMNMLWAISHPLGNDQIALKILFNPFFNIPMYDVVKFTSYLGKHKRDFGGHTIFELLNNKDVFTQAGISEDATTSFSQLENLLQTMRSTASTHGATYALKEFLETTEYFSKHIKPEFMISEMELTFHFLELVGDQSLRAGVAVDSVKEIAEALFTIRAEGVSIKKDKETIPGSIALLTIHSSKGLEFEHVFLTHLDEQTFAPRGADFKLIPAIPHVLDDGKFNFDTESETNDDADTNNSLLFVAMTRAKKGLHLSYVESLFRGKPKKPVELLDNFPIPLEVFDMPEDMRAQALKEVFTVPKQKLPTRAEFGEFLVEKIKENGISSSKLYEFFEAPWTFVLSAILKFSIDETFYIIQGNLYHELVETVIKHAQKNEHIDEQKIKDISGEVYQKFQDEHPNFSLNMDEVCTNAINWWNDFKDHMSGEVFIERSLESLEVDGVKLKGRADILIETKQGIEIYDIKTSKLDHKVSAKGEVKGAYRTQLECYAAMLMNSQKYKGKPIVKNVLYFIKHNEPDSPREYGITVTNSIIDEISSQMKELIESLKTLSFADTDIKTYNREQEASLEIALKKFVDSLPG